MTNDNAIPGGSQSVSSSLESTLNLQDLNQQERQMMHGIRNLSQAGRDMMHEFLEDTYTLVSYDDATGWKRLGMRVGGIKGALVAGPKSAKSKINNDRNFNGVRQSEPGRYF